MSPTYSLRHATGKQRVPPKRWRRHAGSRGITTQEKKINTSNFHSHRLENSKYCIHSGSRAATIYVIQLKVTIIMIPHIKVCIYLTNFAVILCFFAHCITVYGWGLLRYACLFLGRRNAYKYEEATRPRSWWSSGSFAEYNVFSCSLHNELLLPEVSNISY